MKDLKTSLPGKIRNLPGFQSEALLPLFEAVINAIEAIEERGTLSTGEVKVKILRGAQPLFKGADLPITGFEITDDGVGFNDANFESFQTSDSIYKAKRGGKGIGRFLWLKAFDKVEIDSVYQLARKRMRRQFEFSLKSGIGDGVAQSTAEPQKTVVRLIGFKKEYQRLPSAYKTTGKIAQRILEHALSYFVAEGAPRITVQDENETKVLNEIYECDLAPNITQRPLKIHGQDFTLTHLKLYSTYDRMHNIVLCADKRDVKPVSLARALGTSTQFDDDDRKFTYAMYVNSAYLDEHADHYRMDFDLPEDEVVGDSSVVSMNQIVSALSNAAREFLSAYLLKARTKKEERVARYVATENPALRAVPAYCPEVFDEIEPTSTPERIDEVLYHHKGKAEYQIRRRSSELLKTQATSLAEVETSYAKLTADITAFQKDNLVNYLCHRKRIIDVLERKLELNKDGRYANEEVVHDIVFPRKTTTDQLRYEDHNLWLVDEVLAFHASAVSEKPLSQTVESNSDERPDILTFTEIGEDKIARAVSLLEFKKPQRTTFDEDPTRQLYRYLREIKKSKKIKLPNGRDLHVAEDTRYYCCAICDITPAVEEYAVNNNYAKLIGDLGTIRTIEIITLILKYCILTSS